MKSKLRYCTNICMYVHINWNDHIILHWKHILTLWVILTQCNDYYQIIDCFRCLYHFGQSGNCCCVWKSARICDSRVPRLPSESTLRSGLDRNILSTDVSGSLQPTEQFKPPFWEWGCAYHKATSHRSTYPFKYTDLTRESQGGEGMGVVVSGRSRELECFIVL